ncbi:hypothetical protein V2J09_017166 [Rumex salicifolius]
MMSSSYYDYTCQERQPHFLRACYMCNNQLGVNHDIFMYRGNMAFCSEECRRKQIEMDDHSNKKKSWRSLKRGAEAPPPGLNVYKKK